MFVIMVIITWVLAKILMEIMDLYGSIGSTHTEPHPSEKQDHNAQKPNHVSTINLQLILSRGKFKERSRCK